MRPSAGQYRPVRIYDVKGHNTRLELCQYKLEWSKYTIINKSEYEGHNFVKLRRMLLVHFLCIPPDTAFYYTPINDTPFELHVF